MLIKTEVRRPDEGKKLLATSIMITVGEGKEQRSFIIKEGCSMRHTPALLINTLRGEMIMTPCTGYSVFISSFVV